VAEKTEGELANPGLHGKHPLEMVVMLIVAGMV